MAISSQPTIRGYLARKPPVNVLKGLVLANSHVLSLFKDSEESPKGAFLYDTAVMLALELQWMTAESACSILTDSDTFPKVVVAIL